MLNSVMVRYVFGQEKVRLVSQWKHTILGLSSLASPWHTLILWQFILSTFMSCFLALVGKKNSDGIDTITKFPNKKASRLKVLEYL